MYASAADDGCQGLKTDDNDQVTGLITNSKGSDLAHCSSVDDPTQGLKTDGNDQVTGLIATSTGPVLARSCPVNDTKHLINQPSNFLFNGEFGYHYLKLSRFTFLRSSIHFFPGLTAVRQISFVYRRPILSQLMNLQVG